MSHPVVHDGQQPVDWAHDPLHGDAEQQQRERDPQQRVDHAEHLPRGGERGLLAVTCTPKQQQVKSVLNVKAVKVVVGAFSVTQLQTSKRFV